MKKLIIILIVCLLSYVHGQELKVKHLAKNKLLPYEPIVLEMELINTSKSKYSYYTTVRKGVKVLIFNEATNKWGEAIPSEFYNPLSNERGHKKYLEPGESYVFRHVNFLPALQPGQYKIKLLSMKKVTDPLKITIIKPDNDIDKKIFKVLGKEKKNMLNFRRRWSVKVWSYFNDNDAAEFWKSKSIYKDYLAASYIRDRKNLELLDVLNLLPDFSLNEELEELKDYVRIKQKQRIKRAVIDIKTKQRAQELMSEYSKAMNNYDVEAILKLLSEKTVYMTDEPGNLKAARKYLKERLTALRGKKLNPDQQKVSFDIQLDEIIPWHKSTCRVETKVRILLGEKEVDKFDQFFIIIEENEKLKIHDIY